MSTPPSQALCGLRIGAGIGSILAPGITCRALGLDPKAQPQLAMMTRLFGVRELSLGLVTMMAPSSNVWKLNVMTDVSDVAAGLSASKDGSVPKPMALAFAVGAAGAVGIGVKALMAADA